MTMSKFANTIFERTYAHDTAEGKETWPQMSHRVAKNVMRAVGIDMRTTLAKEIRTAIEDKKFVPAGRYLYSAGRPYHQVCNCYGRDTKVVTREGTKSIVDLVGKTPTLMTTGGEWVEAEVKEFGKQQLYKVVLSFGKSEKVIYATAEHSWRTAKYVVKGRFSHKTKVNTIDLTPGDTLWQVYGHGISRTPTSVIGVQHGIVYGDGHTLRDSESCVRLYKEKSELSAHFPLFKTREDEGVPMILGLPSHFKKLPSLDYDRSYLLGWLKGYVATDGCVDKDGRITLSSFKKSDLEFVKNVAYILGIGANPIRYTDSISNLNNKEVRCYVVSFKRSTLNKDFFLRSKHRERFQESKITTTWKVKSVTPTDRVENVYCAVVPDTHEFVLEDNILVGNCLLLRAHDSREGWSEIMAKASKALMTGAGIGVVYSGVRHEGANIRKTGGTASGPIPLMQMVNECGRGVIQGGSRRSAIWAGLNWSHPDVHKFIKVKNWPPEIVSLKERDFSFPATLDHTNISVGLDDAFFQAYNDDEDPKHAMAHSVYWSVIEQMLRTGEPGFTVDTGDNAGEDLRNAPLSADTHVLTQGGYKMIRELVGKATTLWTGKRWAKDVVFEKTGENVEVLEVQITGGRKIKADPKHEFFVERWEGAGTRRTLKSIDKVPANELQEGDILKSSFSLPPRRSQVKVLKVVKCLQPEDVFCCDVRWGEHSFVAEGVLVSNCCEVTSEDTDDICNLGSVNLANVESIDELRHLLDIGCAFLLAGSVYTDVPYTDVDKVLSTNRRIGLGLMGVHEWMLKRGKPYEPDEELGLWLTAYSKSGKYANAWADEWGLTRPKKTRAIAPNGTTSIVVETTGGIEPIFCVAYKRRYLKGKEIFFQYVVDPCAKRLIEGGVDPDTIEDAYVLSQDVERRVAFQAWMQQFVDHAISSTINLPEWGSEYNNKDLVRPFGAMLIRYLPRLRGITTYPDGSRGGQPLSPVSYTEATKQEGIEMIEEQQNVCSLTGGSCGD